MIADHAFIALEKAVAGTISAGWRKKALALQAHLHTTISDGNWADAHAAVDRLHGLGLVSEHRKRLEELAVSALLFGAHHVTGKVSDTSFVKGTKPIPHVLHVALDQITEMVENSGPDFVRKRITTLIRNQQEARVQKAEDDVQNLADMLNDAVLKGGQMMIDLAANLTTSRLISLGFLSEAMDQGVEKYEVNEILDDRTCPVCEEMDGKIFDVGLEYSKMLTTLGTSDPDELASLSPWPSQSASSVQALSDSDEDDLQSKGLGSPPYHPGCRGFLSLVGTGAGNVQPDTSASDLEDLLALLEGGATAEEIAESGVAIPDDIEDELGDQDEPEEKPKPQPPKKPTKKP